MTSSTLTATADLAATPRSVKGARSPREVARRAERPDASEATKAKGRFADGLEDRLGAKGAASEKEPGPADGAGTDNITTGAAQGEALDGLGGEAAAAVLVPLTIAVVNRLLLEADQRVILKAVKNLGGGAAVPGGAGAGAGARLPGGPAAGTDAGEGALDASGGDGAVAARVNSRVVEGDAGVPSVATNAAPERRAEGAAGAGDEAGVRADGERATADRAAPAAVSAAVPPGGPAPVATGAPGAEHAAGPGSGAAVVAGVQRSGGGAGGGGTAGRGSQTGVGLGLAGGDGGAGQADAGRVEAQVSRGVAAVMAQRGGSVLLRLQPGALGQVRVQLDWERGEVSVRFRVADEKARGLLEQTLPGLRASLEARGLDVLAVAVEPPEQRGPEGRDVPVSGGQVAGTGAESGGGHNGAAGERGSAGAAGATNEGAARSAAGAEVFDGTLGQEAGAGGGGVWLEPGADAGLVRVRVDAWA